MEEKIAEKKESMVGGSPTDGDSSADVEIGTQESVTIDPTMERKYREFSSVRSSSL